MLEASEIVLFCVLFSGLCYLHDTIKDKNVHINAALCFFLNIFWQYMYNKTTIIILNNNT